MYKRIPGFSNYAVSRYGHVINIDKGTEPAQRVNTDGYTIVSMVRDDGMTRNVARHRLVCMTYKPIENPGEMMVNHIDGVKSHDHLDNLEWVTPMGNIVHAAWAGLTPKCIPIDCLDVETGKQETFVSFLDCAIRFNMSKDEIAYRMKQDDPASIIWPENRRYRKHDPDNGPWPEKVKFLNGRNVAIQAKDLKTGEILEFKNATEASKFFRIGISGIMNRLARPQRVFAVKYLIRDAAKRDDPWPDEEPQQHTRGVRLTYPDGRVEEFNSARECAKSLGIIPTTLGWRLSRGSHGKGSEKVLYEYTCPPLLKSYGPKSS